MRHNGDRKLFIGVLIFGALVLAYIFFFGNGFTSIVNTEYTKQLQSRLQSSKFLKQSADEEPITSDSCDLSIRDPWDPEIQRYLNPNSHPLKNCKPTMKTLTTLVDGQLILTQKVPSNATCKYQCFTPKPRYDIEKSAPTIVINGSRPQCDLIRVECKYAGTSDFFYRNDHLQTYRARLPRPAKEYPEKYDVHMLILDSVSHPQFIRSLPQTRYLLETFFDAIPFPHLNKIGFHSYENCFPLLFGKTFKAVQQTPFTRFRRSDYPSKDSIKYFKETYLDNDQFIGFRFKDDGYVTLMSEDAWFPVVKTYPAKGFHNVPVDHMKPFVSVFTAGISKSLCRESYYEQIEYLQSFMKTYPDKPKFSITWNAYLAHDNSNGLYHADDYFYRFFQQSMKDLDNAFVFITADHGKNFNGFVNTNAGETESNNPAFHLIVPKKLRQNETLMKILRDNSKQLVTHYDIYATLVDITKPEKPRIPKPLIKGSSLLRVLPQPRNCDSLQIPFGYCLCNKRLQSLPKNNSIGLPLAQYGVTKINEVLKSHGSESSQCAELSLKPGADINVMEYQLGTHRNLHLYRITFITTPGDGRFEGYMAQYFNGTTTMVSDEFKRRNAYAPQVKCLKSKFIFAPYCYCKDLLSVTTVSG